MLLREIGEAWDNIDILDPVFEIMSNRYIQFAASLFSNREGYYGTAGCRYGKGNCFLIGNW